MKKYLPFLILFALGLLVYANSLFGDFMQDDFALIVENEFLRSWGSVPEFFTNSVIRGSGYLSNLYRPVALMFYFVLYQVFELNVVGYHLFNILLHIVNACLVFCLFKRLKFVEMGAFLAAVLFLVHPTQVESVSYIAGLPDVLSSFFVILGLTIWAKADKWRDQVGVAMLFVLGLFTKESAIVLLPMIVVLSFYQKNWKERIWGFVLMSVVAGAYLVLKFVVLDFVLESGSNTYTENLGFRLIYFVNTIWDYLVILVWPVTLYFERIFDATIFGNYLDLISWKTMVGTMFVALGGIFAWRFERFRLFYLWFLAALIPYMGIVPANAPYKEHWLYIPLIGVLVLVATAYEKFRKYRKQIMAVCVLLTVLFSVRVVMRNFEWADPVKFFENEIAHARIDYRMHFGLGEYYFHNDDLEKAFESFETGLIESQLICESCSYFLARTAFEMGDEETGWQYVRGCLSDNPNYMPMYYYLEADEQLERLDRQEWLNEEDVEIFLEGKA
jgi:protein O-mannosyl-transferase